MYCQSCLLCTYVYVVVVVFYIPLVVSCSLFRLFSLPILFSSSCFISCSSFVSFLRHILFRLSISFFFGPSSLSLGRKRKTRLISTATTSARPVRVCSHPLRDGRGARQEREGDGTRRARAAAAEEEGRVAGMQHTPMTSE